MSAGVAIEKRCQACGATFGCGAQLASCWCQDLPKLPSASIDPAADCFCPACLRERTATQITPEVTSPAAGNC